MLRPREGRSPGSAEPCSPARSRRSWRRGRSGRAVRRSPPPPRRRRFCDPRRGKSAARASRGSKADARVQGAGDGGAAPPPRHTSPQLEEHAPLRRPRSGAPPGLERGPSNGLRRRDGHPDVRRVGSFTARLRVSRRDANAGRRAVRDAGDTVVEMRSSRARGLRIVGPSCRSCGSRAVVAPVEPPGARRGASGSKPLAPPATVRASRLPMRFEQNAGQHAPGVRFVARSRGAALFLTDEGATLRFAGSDAPLTMKVSGGRSVTPRADERLITRSNYLIGKDPSKWHRDIPNFGRVTYPGARDGVDVVFHGEDGQLEYDFVVAPGVDPGARRDGCRRRRGPLAHGLRRFRDSAPRERWRGAARARSASATRVSATDDGGVEGGRRGDCLIGGMGRWPSRWAPTTTRARASSVIDPVLSYSTYLGGAADEFSRQSPPSTLPAPPTPPGGRLHSTTRRRAPLAT